MPVGGILRAFLGEGKQSLLLVASVFRFKIFQVHRIRFQQTAIGPAVPAIEKMLIYDI